MSTQTDETMPAWIGRYDCGCVVAVSIAGPDDFVIEEDPDIVKVEKTTVDEARKLLTSAHSRPTCEVLAERDRARDIAVALEQQTAEALRIAHSVDEDDSPWKALNAIVRVLEGADDGR